jgi:hypothetical protein
MTLALTLDHYRVAAACTFGATASVIQRTVFGVTSGLPEKFYTSRLINDLRAARLLQQSADGHFWLAGEEGDDSGEPVEMAKTEAADERSDFDPQAVLLEAFTRQALRDLNHHGIATEALEARCSDGLPHYRLTWPGGASQVVEAKEVRRRAEALRKKAQAA